MRSRSVPAVLLALTLGLAACGGDDGASDEPSPAPTAAAEGDDAGAELAEGVAATVNGTEIPAALLDARVETAAAAPQLAEILEGEDGDAARAQLQASILSQLIVNEIVVDGAEERGLAIDEDAVAETREELTTQAGGQDAFDDQIEQAGLDEEQLAAELEAITALRLVRDDLTGEADGTPPPAAPAPDGSTPDPADALLQQWLLEQLQGADIAVAPAIGSWDATQGTVVPAGAQAPSTGQPGPETTPEATSTEG